MTRDSVIRRMLRPASGPSPAAAAGIGRIWGNAIARVAEDRLGLPLEAGTAAIERAHLAGFLASIPQHAMLLRLEDTQSTPGLVLVGADTVAALVEMHTMRRLRPTAPDTRPPTRTDAAIVTPVIDAALAMLTDKADAGLVPKWAAGWQIAAFAPDPRPLGLTMPDLPYRRVTLPLVFGLDRGRASDLTLLVPDGTSGVQGLPRPDETPDDWQDQLGRAAMPAPAEVRGVLWRLTMPLGAIAALRVGDSLTIPEEAIDGVRVESPDGRCLAVGRLGQLRGDRAVRLREFAGPDGEIGTGADAVLSSGPGGADMTGGFLSAGLPAADGGSAMDMAAGMGMPMGLDGGGLPPLGGGDGSLPPLGGGDAAPAFSFAPIDDLPDRID